MNQWRLKKHKLQNLAREDQVNPRKHRFLFCRGIFRDIDYLLFKKPMWDNLVWSLKLGDIFWISRTLGAPYRTKTRAKKVFGSHKDFCFLGLYETFSHKDIVLFPSMSMCFPVIISVGIISLSFTSETHFAASESKLPTPGPAYAPHPFPFPNMPPPITQSNWLAYAVPFCGVWRYWILR